jgi:serine/threonine protein phosphatase PrpC
MIFASKSITGRVKKRNEDRHFVRKLSPDTVLIALADGLGGQPAGDVAAQTAVDFVEKNIESLTHPGAADLYRLVLKADTKIARLAKTGTALEYMGTTLLVALCTPERVFWTHVGDSRLYLFRDRTLRQITKDQTMAQFLADEGEIEKKDLASHPMQGLLEQSLGNGDCEPVSGSFPVIPGDTVLVCTDGLYSEIEDQRIIDILARNTAVTHRIDELITAADDAGGKDNITAIALDIT